MTATFWAITFVAVFFLGLYAIALWQQKKRHK